MTHSSHMADNAITIGLWPSISWGWIALSTQGFYMLDFGMTAALFYGLHYIFARQPISFTNVEFADFANYL